MRTIILIIWLACVTPAFSQGVELAPVSLSAYDSARATYVKAYPDHFFLWPLLKRRSLDYRLQDIANDRKTLTYKSTRPYFVGIGMYVFEVVLELTVAIPFDERNNTRYGSSNANDLQVNLLGKKWGIESSWQKYEGFYISDPSVTIPADKAYPQRPDIVMRNTGITGTYIFNHKKFSFRSSYNFADRQVHSAGSFLALATLSGFEVGGDSAILGKNYTGDFGSNSMITEFKSTVISVAPGYSYSLVHKGFFINATLALAPAPNWLSYRTEDGQEHANVRITAYYIARLGLGYSDNRFFTGISYAAQGGNAKYDGIQVLTASGTFKVLVGYRFREVGFLKKRLVDLPKVFGIGR